MTFRRHGYAPSAGKGRALEPLLSQLENAPNMARRFDIESLMEEVDRLAAVELFRALGCEPGWRAELDSERQHAEAGRVERLLHSDIRLH